MEVKGGVEMGKREREGPPVITLSPGSRGARIVTAPNFCMFSVEPLIYSCVLYTIENSRTVCEIFDF